MSAGFVSGGTTEKPAQRNELWVKAEQELESARQRKAEQKNHDGKSLYEVLQANKAAKQEAFEESMKLKNQFRSLDEIDIDFLNSVQDADDAKQKAVQAETVQQLELFRKQQEKQDESRLSGDITNSSSSIGETTATDDGRSHWRVTKKRKRPGAERNLAGSKTTKSQLLPSQTGRRARLQDKAIGAENKADRGSARRLATPEGTPTAPATTNQTALDNQVGAETSIKSASNVSGQDDRVIRAIPGLGLAGYSSDEDQ